MKLIFTVTPGRSGSAYLTQLLGAVPGVEAQHEPEPNFVHVMRRVQQNPAVAEVFLRECKLPALAAVTAEVYAETSHLVCKGFIEPIIRMGLRPGLIILRRPPREVAWSLFERDTVPGRSTAGFSYLLEPRDPNVLPLLGWETATDYQLCFWYALEIERRQLRYAAMARDMGLPVADVTNKELNDWGAFSRMLGDLGGLPATEEVRQAHARISGQRHNENKRRQAMPDGLDAAEQQIWDRIGHYEPLLADKVAKRYA